MDGEVEKQEVMLDYEGSKICLGDQEDEWFTFNRDGTPVRVYLLEPDGESDDD